MLLLFDPDVLFWIVVTGKFSELNISYFDPNPNVLNFGQSLELARDSALFRWKKGVHGHLVTFNTLEKYNYIKNSVLTGSFSSSWYWIGASDAASPGVWLWVSGPDAGEAISPEIAALLPADNPNGYACLAISSTGLSYQDCNSHAINMLVEYRCPPTFALGPSQCERTFT